MTFYGRFCATLVSLYPNTFQKRHAEELIAVVVHRLTIRRKTRGFFAMVKLAAKEIIGLISGLGRAWIAQKRSTRVGRRHTPAGNTTLTELAHAFRNWRRHPWHTTAVILTLAIGIGANTAIFSVVSGVLLRPLNYQEPDNLALIWNHFDWLGDAPTWVHDLQVKSLRDEASRFEGLAAMRMVSGRILGGPTPVHADVARVSSEFFDLLRVNTPLGRTFNEEDDDFGAPWVAILSHDYWTREFQQDSSVIGRQLRIGFFDMEIIGVLPADFDYRMYEALGKTVVPQLWSPGSGVAVLARLNTGSSFAQAATQLDSLAADHRNRFFSGASFEYQMVPLINDITREVRPALLVLFGAVGFILLIAIANVATMVLGRAQCRTNEFAVRYALGGSHWKILRELILENALPAIAGAVLGVSFAVWGVEVLLNAMPVELPRARDVSVDLPVLGFALVATVFAAIVPALIPALHARKTDPSKLLNTGSRNPALTHRTQRTKGLLVVIQVTLSVVLLAGATLSIRSFLQVSGADLGFSREDVLTFSAYLMQEYETPQQRDEFFIELEDRVGRLPGVAAVSATTALPFSAPSFGPVFLEPQPEPIRYTTWPGQGVEPDPQQLPAGRWLMSDINAVRPNYFNTTGITVISGREFVQQDAEFSPPHVLVDETLAAAFWPGTDAVGETVWVFNTEATVAGVVRHAVHHAYGSPGRPQLYIPYAGVARTLRTSVVVRTEKDPLRLLPAIRTAIHAIDPLVPIADIETMNSRVNRSTANQRFLTTLMTGFATIALILAALGIYGVLAFAVANRRQEFAVRIAMGATRSHISMLVMNHALRLTGIGLLIGMAMVVTIGIRLDGLLFGVPGADPVSIAVALFGLLAVTGIAAWWPVRHAASIDARSTLRSH